MKQWKLFLIAMMTVPWLSIPFLGKQSLKRFLPASLIMSLIVVIESYIARKRTWWWVYKNLFPKVIGEIPLIFGPFLVGSLWVLKVTYRKFFLFVILNSIVHLIFAYPGMDMFKKMGIGSTVRLKRWQLMMLFFFKSILLYGLQDIIERMGKKTV
jgi:hypothetical protein